MQLLLNDCSKYKSSCKDKAIEWDVKGKPKAKTGKTQSKLTNSDSDSNGELDSDDIDIDIDLKNYNVSNSNANSNSNSQTSMNDYFVSNKFSAKQNEYYNRILAKAISTSKTVSYNALKTNHLNKNGKS